MRLMTLSGSLRAVSSNSAALEALRLLAPGGIEVQPWHGLDTLPHFNPDLDTEAVPQTPPAVAALRRAVGECQALVISSPEYAHGVPGSLKNALDWLVSCAEFPGKPILLVNTSPRSVHAQAALAETLRTMSGRLVEPGVVLPLSGRVLDGVGIAADTELAALLRGGVEALLQMARQGA